MKTRGFTLIEVLVAMTLLTMAFAVLFSISSRSLDGLQRAENTERRVEFARNTWDKLKLISDLEPGDRASGVLEDGTRWGIDVASFIAPALTAARPSADSMVHVRFSMEWQGRREPQSWSVDAYRLMKPRLTPHEPLERQLDALIAPR